MLGLPSPKLPTSSAPPKIPNERWRYRYTPWRIERPIVNSESKITNSVRVEPANEAVADARF